MTSRDRRAILLGAIGLGIIAVVWFLVFPAIDAWRAARTRIHQAHEQLADLEAKTQRLTFLDKRVQAAYGPGAGKPLETLADTRISFIKTVINLVSANGIGMRSVQPETVRPLRDVPGVVTVSFQVQGTGQLPQLVQLLAALKNSDSLVIIDRAEAVGNPQSPGQLNINLVLTTLARQEVIR